jgi:hypothetical protein
MEHNSPSSVSAPFGMPLRHQVGLWLNVALRLPGSRCQV